MFRAILLRIYAISRDSLCIINNVSGYRTLQEANNSLTITMDLVYVRMTIQKLVSSDLSIAVHMPLRIT